MYESGCNANMEWGSGSGFATASYPPRPLGCPTDWGGTGPDYANQTPILIGTGYDPTLYPPGAFSAYWGNTGSNSHGTVKAKAGPTGTQYRLVFRIISGEYAPPPGKKTKVKLMVSINPAPGWSYTCVDDSEPLPFVALESVGNVIITQK